jgi:hypothetical protein
MNKQLNPKKDNMTIKKLFTPCFSISFSVLLFSMLLVSCGGEFKEDKTTAGVRESETPVASESYNDYLTAADIEKVSGLTGVKSIPRDPGKGAGGNLNFSASDDNLIVMVQFVNKSYYEGSLPI